MAISNQQHTITSATNSVLSQQQAMSVTKRHLQGEGSSKWLPTVSFEKKMRASPNNTTI